MGPSEGCEHRTDTIDLDVNWITLAAVLRLDGGGAKDRNRGPTKAFCSENGKGMDQSGIGPGDETWSVSGYVLRKS